MEIRKETVCEDTLNIIRQYYRPNTEPLFSVLSDDCVWLSVGNLLVSGAEAIRMQFQNGFLMPSFALEEPSFRQIGTGKHLVSGERAQAGTGFDQRAGSSAAAPVLPAAQELFRQLRLRGKDRAV